MNPIKFIEDQIQRVSDYLTQGQAKSYEEYRQHVGMIEAYRRTLTNIREYEKARAKDL